MLTFNELLNLLKLIYLKKIVWLFKRHPFLYYARFKLLSKYVTKEDIKKDTYNSVNIKEHMPSLFFEINKKIFDSVTPEGSLGKAKQISVWLNKHIVSGSGLSLSSEEALSVMLGGGGGVCSDMAQIFNNFCVINDIQVREWGLTVQPFNKKFGGHSINEVYCDKLKKWVLLDVANTLIFFNKNNDYPLSVLEFFEIKEHDNVNYNLFSNVPNDNRKKLIDKIFFNKNVVPFLISNYRNKVYDKYLGRLRPLLPVFLIHFLLYVMNKSYHYKFV